MSNFSSLLLSSSISIPEATGLFLSRSSKSFVCGIWWIKDYVSVPVTHRAASESQSKIPRMKNGLQLSRVAHWPVAGKWGSAVQPWLAEPITPVQEVRDRAVLRQGTTVDGADTPKLSNG